TLAYLDASGNTFVPRRLHTTMRPRHFRSQTTRPLRIDGREIAREGRGGTARVEPRHECDVACWQGHAWIGRRNGGIVPVGDGTGEDAGIGGAGQLEVPREAPEVVGEHHHPGGRWNLDDSVLHLASLVGCEHCIARREINGVRHETLDAFAGPNRVIGEGDVLAYLRIVLEPHLVKRGGKGCAGAAQGERL